MTGTMTTMEPLINPYLWALGDAALDLVPGTEIAGRYRVVAPQIWLDMQPGQAIEHPEDIHRELLPYLYLYPQRLHLPVIYDICPLEDDDAPVVLLENVPLEGAGSLQPALKDQITQASALRQVSWFWQILSLWEPLSEMGVAASLLVEDNLRVEGWRLRLRELYASLGEDKPLGFGLAKQRYVGDVPLADLSMLGQKWNQWVAQSHQEVRPELLALGEQLQSSDASLTEISHRLNLLLLQQSSKFPLRMQAAGHTDSGPEHRQNEDSCYPLPSDLKNRGMVPDSQLIPHLSIVCDGIGGHEGGEVASQMAVRSIKLQMQAFLNEFSTSTSPVPPEVIMEQLAAAARVANNLISSQNNAQSRNARQRMGTTLVMTVHVQQPLAPEGPFSHEVYLVNVGDSRAYWITERHCHGLTVDNDVATREVRTGRSFYRSALQRSDAGSLTQALGTRDGENLSISVRRLILDEDGLLLLCSDGLSDNGQVELAWADTVAPLLGGQVSLEQAAQDWVELANSRNGHDNTSVVVNRCRISPEYPVLIGGEPTVDDTTPADSLTAASEALRATVPSSAVPTSPSSGRFGAILRAIISILLILGLGGLIGFIAFRQLNKERERPALPGAETPVEILPRETDSPGSEPAEGNDLDNRDSETNPGSDSSIDETDPSAIDDDSVDGELLPSEGEIEPAEEEFSGDDLETIPEIVE